MKSPQWIGILLRSTRGFLQINTGLTIKIVSMKLYKIHQIEVFIIACCLILAGCGDPYAPTIQRPQLASVQVLGYSVQQRPIELITVGTGGGEKVMIVATIHGNEDAGTPLVYRLIDKLRARPALLVGCTVLIVPLANPDGQANRTRANASGIDLNRNFPASNRINNEVHGQQGLTEPESRILYDLVLAYQPTHIVSIHQPLYCLDYDGPGEDIARHMGRYCSLPVKKLGSRPGSMGSFVGVEQNIPIITMELAKEDSELTTAQLWNRYGRALLAAITYPKQPYQ
ncbi:MAG: hypothetical protein DRP52_01880 [Planctomycetota bacterium]|nr:MAG: hypothetical protein DRP52_01880 [Planctomycetota bacterium]